MFVKVYDDFLKGMFDEEKFNLISSNYTKEQKYLKEEIKKIQEELEQKNIEEENIDSFINIIENHSKIKKLNATIINTLIDKVVVSETEVTDGEKTQKINIIYKFVGSIGQFSYISTESESAASVEEQTASAQEIASSSAHLADMAQELTEMIAVFKI